MLYMQTLEIAELNGTLDILLLLICFYIDLFSNLLKYIKSAILFCGVILRAPFAMSCRLLWNNWHGLTQEMSP